MREVIKTAIDTLHKLMDDIETLDGVSDKLADTKSRLNATVEAHEEVSEKLLDDRKLLDERQHDALQRHEAAIFEKTKELRSLTEQVEAKRSEFADIDALVKSKRQEHNQVLESMAVLRSKLA